MPAKKILAAALIGSLLAGCGGNNYQAPLPGDGTYDSGVLPADDYGYGGDDYASGGTDGGYTDPGTATPGAGVSQGFVLKGIVLDKATNKPLARAKVSIGASTQLTAEDGTFEFPNISDTQVWVTVTMDGYAAIDQFNVGFTAEKPTADKEFLLAPSGSTGGGTGTPSKPASGFSHVATFGAGKFKSVSAMATVDDVVYVLGVVDGFLWLNRNSVVAFDAASGQELVTFNKVGTLATLPKDADSLKVEDGTVLVSNGETSYVFRADGTFVEKTSGARYSPIREVTDEDRKITYAVKGSSKIDVTIDGETTAHGMSEVMTIKALGLDEDGGLLVLDGGNSTVHRFEFQP